MATQKDKDVVVETINILVSTNIPDQANVSLTSKVIVSSSINAKLYNEYPYITDTIRIRGGFLINKPYNDILDYFFIKDTFVRYTKEMMKTKDENEEEQDNADEESDKRVKYIEWNIKTMLRMIFNTFPINGNVTSSLEKDYIDKLYNINKYSYLSISSKKYTIAKVVWIDDIYNHYVTKQLVKDYKNFTAWKTNELRSIENRKTDYKSGKTRIINWFSDVKHRAIVENNIDGLFKNIQSDGNVPPVGNADKQNRAAVQILLAHLSILNIKLFKADVNTERSKFIQQDSNNKTIPQDRLDAIDGIIQKNDTYNADTPEFIVELKRTLDIVVKGNIVPIHSIIQDFIKDLSDNNTQLITVEGEKNALSPLPAFFGNPKYKNENYKNLTDAIMKDLKIVKSMINLDKQYLFNINNPLNETFDKAIFTTYMVINLVNRIQQTDLMPNIKNDKAGIIFDNNNVKTPKFEVYFYIDLIDGYVTDDSQSELDLCGFRDELLLIKFNQIMNDEIYALQHDPLIKVVDINKDKDKGKEKEKGTKGGTKKNRVIRNKTQRISKLW
uniref:Uncharacterized protein n=1 Tax=viral metagenome TaxID=1070528 RepID=A0A6C0F2N4_9ZZZZ